MRTKLILNFLAVLALLYGYSSAAAQQPNVIVILTDDQGYGEIASCSIAGSDGGESCRPHAVCPCPACVPATKVAEFRRHDATLAFGAWPGTLRHHVRFGENK